ncbi:fatty acid desaturase family protein [Yinghuangia soli]|uniref:Fatty acid desaturase n=1 Tax=Yinghuangia soli TaxID=2908204 RepID=A0AA41TZG2_9ACTN|nr:fatty acid desaturase [Yinghuangia soli]MCF2527250.1 fatty acid desaturase [Yinghuangia soli]
MGLEAVLRAYRKDELRHRRRPPAVRYWSDLAVRAAALAMGYALCFAASPLLYVPGVVLFALVSVSMIGSWFHDALHGNVPGGRWRVAAILRAGSAPTGIGPRWWFHKHVQLHHRHVGDARFDPDIQFHYFGRVTADQQWFPQHRYQHLYMWFLLPFSTLNMLKPSELWTVRREAVQAVLGGRGRRYGWVLLLDKYLPHVLVWAPLFAWLPLGRAAALYLAFHLIAGTFVSLITQVQHNTDLAEYGGGGETTASLVTHLRRSTDVGQRRGFWYWLSGGTTYHVVHHLAPSLSFQELPYSTKRLVSALEGTGERVRVHPGMWAAVKSHGRLIRTLSNPPDEAKAVARGTRENGPVGEHARPSRA